MTAHQFRIQAEITSGIDICKEAVSVPLILMKPTIKKQWKKPAVKDVLISLESTAYSASV